HSSSSYAAMPRLCFVVPTLLERQQLAYPVRFAQRPQTLEDRQGARQIDTRLCYVALLLVEPTVAGVGESQFILGPDLLQNSHAALEMGCSQRGLALGRVAGQGDLSQEPMGRGQDEPHPMLLRGGEERFEGLPGAAVLTGEPVGFTEP